MSTIDTFQRTVAASKFARCPRMHSFPRHVFVLPINKDGENSTRTRTHSKLARAPTPFASSISTCFCSPSTTTAKMQPVPTASLHVSPPLSLAQHVFLFPINNHGENATRAHSKLARVPTPFSSSARVSVPHQQPRRKCNPCPQQVYTCPHPFHPINNYVENATRTHSTCQQAFSSSAHVSVPHQKPRRKFNPCRAHSKLTRVPTPFSSSARVSVPHQQQRQKCNPCSQQAYTCPHLFL